jgi:hypothetical protein
MIHTLRNIGVGVAMLVLGTAASASAQDKRFDLTAAYQYQHLSCCDTSRNMGAGFNVDVAGKLTPMLQWVGQIDFSKHSDDDLGTSEKLTAYAAGVRWSAPATSFITPFAQVLLGAAHDSFDVTNNVLSASNSQTKFLFDVDGGVAYPLTQTKTVSAVGEIGYRRIAEDPGLNGFRVVFGVRFKV